MGESDSVLEKMFTITELRQLMNDNISSWVYYYKYYFKNMAISHAKCPAEPEFRMQIMRFHLSETTTPHFDNFEAGPY